jgi:DNA helicase-2/ATP-dependent DNA helicase PcrA
VSAVASGGPRYTPQEIAEMLHLRTRPTEEQEAIIAAPVAPMLVVAGAGSGKTETMAARVVWLVANGYARPEQVLGLTFTRKAAGELASRIRQRLGQLARRLGDEADTASGEPTVATYHSYAVRIATEHGVRSGFEPTARLLTEASCWQLADAVTRAYAGDMSAVSYAPTTVVDAVLRLAAELAEHLQTPDDLAAWTGRLNAEVTASPGRQYRPVADMLALQNARLALLPLVREYTRRKLDAESMDFGDQLARAALVARAHPAVGEIERDRFRVVLLDEFQDTSHAQVTLLRALFGGGHPVTAVGDPCQSIYGWRGASAGTLDRFPDEFPDRRGRPATQFTLSTSWRNRPEILSIANDVSGPLRAYGHRVTRLRASEHALDQLGTSTVRCALLETYEDEAAWIADRMAAAWRQRAGLGMGADLDAIAVGDRPLSAVLVRTRRQIAPIERALRAAGLPVEVVGLGGLLDTPEVRDVVSTLRVLGDPLAGAALLRLLTGARWRIGPRDLVALHARARTLYNMRNATGSESGPGVALLPGHLDEAALVDALDDLGPAESYSPEGFRRMSVLAAELRGLRSRLDQPLDDLVADVEREMGLSVEVSVRSSDTGLARAHLDAFAETAAHFASEAQGATLTAFLAFLEAAEAEERGLEPGETDVVDGAVQVLTAHAAKGLEWDIVAVAGLTEGIFPGRPKKSDHYLGGIGVLPFPLRGDNAGLPSFRLAGATDQTDVRDALATFGVDWEAHSEREERRLAYVAVTRPKQLLLCSGFWWSEGNVRWQGPSPFLAEVRDTCAAGAGVVDAWIPPPPDGATNPTTEVTMRATWPQDPLGSRRPVMAAAADEVRRAPAAWSADTIDDPAVRVEAERWAHEVDLLLAERERHRPTAPGAVDVALPGQLSVSHLVELRDDPARLAARLRRPMPRRPDPRSRRGTAFHRWLEQRFGGDQLLDLDELPGAGDEGAAADADLAMLQAKFLASRWADRMPVAVEVGFATVVAGIVIRGRMDAVFGGSDGTYDVVDWKTGPPPSGRHAEAAAVQLGAYRLAWAELAGVPVENVRAAFYYVRNDVTVRPSDLIDADGLVALVASVPVAT